MNKGIKKKTINQNRLGNIKPKIRQLRLDFVGAAFSFMRPALQDPHRTRLEMPLKLLWANKESSTQLFSTFSARADKWSSWPSIVLKKQVYILRYKMKYKTLLKIAGIVFVNLTFLMD